jgi:HAD superfamily hydrolase (TIGR01509 family)
VYKAIIFDLSEVLLTGSYGQHIAVSKRLGIEVTDKDFFIPSMDDFFHGKISERDYWIEVIRANSWKIKPLELEQIIRTNFREIEGVRTIIEHLRQQGYKLGLLSIHTKEWVEYCQAKFHYHSLFDALSYSYESGISKPSPEAYVDILNKLNEAPQDCVFVDDNIYNLISASQLGIRSILFQSAEQLKSELTEAGVIGVDSSSHQ